MLGVAKDMALHMFYELLSSTCARVLPASRVTAQDVLAAEAVVLAETASILPPELLAAARRVVLWNTEQATRACVIERLRSDAAALSRLGVPFILADYSRGNMRLLAPHVAPLAIAHMPCVPSGAEIEALRRLLAATPKRYDVGFTGYMTPRRRGVLHACAAAGLRVCRVDAFGSFRDAALAACCCLLNVHADADYGIFEAVRCARWMAAGMLVVTERGLDGLVEDDPPDADCAAVGDLHELPALVRRRLRGRGELCASHGPPLDIALATDIPDAYAGRGPLDNPY